MSPYKPIVKTANSIKVIYLLDILFLLLILFMIYSINSRPVKSIVLDLPKSKLGLSTHTKQATISLLQNKLYVNKIICNKSVFNCLQNQNISPSHTLLINAPSTLALQKFINLIDQLQSNKYLRFELEVKQS